ncbi:MULTISPECIES: hypothetical protein [Exiguobacterium]|uniref:Uncharacterized protein n=1 Tax=Exiguobacterium sp. (strain ATCC BAA-1283 / AT1b) TaxID=360911 RepID=C4L1X9_EXISA|nr:MULTISPECIES: hypothetical protein [Exiguobacterium]ACQ69153.1 hypothetical protein EAT1b_0220 [Exiguobacterium sp. AT1b]MDX5981887.1 hypothetical protein [Exiguobacterium profundum]QLQ22032.1 MAG: hypothetical protein HZT42_06605 [Paracoccaceae bacterium]QUP85837.1 hypothetical protein KD909_07570 [Exiguobacterium sp. PFWT01]
MTKKRKDLMIALTLIIFTIAYFWLIPNLMIGYIWVIGTIILLVLSSLYLTRLIQSYVSLSLMKFVLIMVISFLVLGYLLIVQFYFVALYQMNHL